MNGLGFGVRTWNEVRISMDMLKKQGAFDGELPSFICDTDTYKWCSCAKPLVNGVCTRKRCKERVYETSSSDFLKYMTVRLPGEIAMVFGSHDGMWCVTSHETGGSMNAPVLHNDRICTGHTHPSCLLSRILSASMGWSTAGGNSTRLSALATLRKHVRRRTQTL